METYLLVLYVTLEQEAAVRRLYSVNGWVFDKIDVQPEEVSRRRSSREKKLKSQLFDISSYKSILCRTNKQTQTSETAGVVSDMPNAEIPIKLEAMDKQKNVTETAKGSKKKRKSGVPLNINNKITNKQKSTPEIVDNRVVENADNSAVTAETEVPVVEKVTTILKPATAQMDQTTVKSKLKKSRKKQMKEREIEMDSKGMSSTVTTKAISNIKAKAVNNNLSKETSDNKMLHCPQCPRVFQSSNPFDRHLRQHKNREFDCKECGKKFGNPRNLRAHMFTRAKDKSLFECDICKLMTTTACLMRKHKREIHPRQEIFQCHLCAKIIKTKSYLNVHLKYTHNIYESKYECHICGKKCQRPKHFARHMAVHETGSYNDNECSICGKEFRTKLLLRSHTRIHKEKKYLCGVCGKGFTTNSKLETHTRIHSGLKPHKCKHCAYESTQAGNLRLHMKTHERMVVKVNDFRKGVANKKIAATNPKQPANKPSSENKMEEAVNNDQCQTVKVKTSQGHNTNVKGQNVNIVTMKGNLDAELVLKEEAPNSEANQGKLPWPRVVTKTKAAIDTDTLKRYPKYFRLSLYEGQSSPYVAQPSVCSESEVEDPDAFLNIDTCTRSPMLSEKNSSSVYIASTVPDYTQAAVFPQHPSYCAVKYVEASQDIPEYAESPKLDTVFSVKEHKSQLMDQSTLNDPGYSDANSLPGQYIQPRSTHMGQNNPISESEHLYATSDHGIFSESLTSVSADRISSANFACANQSSFSSDLQNLPINTYCDPALPFYTSNEQSTTTEEFQITKTTDLSSNKLQTLVYDRVISNDPTDKSYDHTDLLYDHTDKSYEHTEQGASALETDTIDFPGDPKGLFLDPEETDGGY